MPTGIEDKMGKENWAIFKQNKNFNIKIYRGGLTVLILAMLLNTGIGSAIAYIYLHEPERDFYATSGIAPPIQLTALTEPNRSSHPLLDPDPPTDNSVRVLPK